MSNSNFIDEKKLIREVKTGSELSFGILYRLWVSRLYKFVYYYVKSENIADDIVQETFIRVWDNRKKIDITKSFKSYLFTISYRLLLKELQRQLNSPLVLEMFEYEENDTIVTTDITDIEKKISYDEFAKTLEKAKKNLSPRQREIFEMNKEEELSIAEISQKLNIKNQVVRNQLSIALKIIRSELTRYLHFFVLFLMTL